MATAADLGISEQEFQDAINLERIYGLVNAVSNHCTRCGEKGITHADKEAYELLCSNCARGRARCKRIGDSRFRTYEVDKFEEKFGRTASKGRRNNTPPRGVKGSHADGRRKGRNSKAKTKKNRRYEASSDGSSEDSDDSMSTTLSGSDTSTTELRKKKRDSKGSKGKSKKSSKEKNLSESWDAQGDPFSQQQWPAGMLGLYQQAGMQPQMQSQARQPGLFGVAPSIMQSSPFAMAATSMKQSSPFGIPGTNMNANAMNFTAGNRSMQISPNGRMIGGMTRMSQQNNIIRPLMPAAARNPFAASMGAPRLGNLSSMNNNPNARLLPTSSMFGGNRAMAGASNIASNPWGSLGNPSMGMSLRQQPAQHTNTIPFLQQGGSRNIWGQQQNNPFQHGQQGIMMPQMMQQQNSVIRPPFGIQQPRSAFSQPQAGISMFGAPQQQQQSAVDSGWW